MALILCVFGVLLGLQSYLRVWQIDDNGLSIISKTTPYWDFNNLWVGAKLALSDHVGWIFEPDIYHDKMQELLGVKGAEQEWSYPPSMLLFGAPFSGLPIFPAYLLWTFGSIVILYFAARTLKLPHLHTIAITLSPAIFYNALYGQNGAVIAALLIAGLTLLPRRPVLAGILIGLLTVKPQFGLLIPFILIANQNWRAFGAAAVTSVLLFIATGFAFGFHTWSLFFTETQPMMRSIMEAPYQQPYQINASTIFMSVRATGSSLLLAYGVQILVSIACAGIAIFLWRKDNQIDHRLRVAVTLVLIFLSTPYAYTYDMVFICAAITVFYAIIPKLKFAALFGLVWLFPLFNHVLFLNFGFSFGGLIMSLLLFLMLTNINSKSIDDLTPETF
jgi:hypothetical protein